MIKLILAILLFSTLAFCQSSSVSVMDFVKIKDNKTRETLYFYENNWKLYREEALKNKFIVSYKILQTQPDATSDFDLILVTEYADSAQLKLGEERFQGIIKKLRPNGPKLLNELKPADFRQNVYVRYANTLFQGSNL